MTKFNKNTSNRSKAYTPDEIAKIMELLRLNNYNISQTSKTTGVSRVTLGKWGQKYQPGSRLEDRTKQFDEQVEAKSLAFRAEGESAEKVFIEKAFAIKAKALVKMKTLHRT